MERTCATTYHNLQNKIKDPSYKINIHEKYKFLDTNDYPNVKDEQRSKTLPGYNELNNTYGYDSIFDARPSYMQVPPPPSFGMLEGEQPPNYSRYNNKSRRVCIDDYNPLDVKFFFIANSFFMLQSISMFSVDIYELIFSKMNYLVVANTSSNFIKLIVLTSLLILFVKNKRIFRKKLYRINLVMTLFWTFSLFADIIFVMNNFRRYEKLFAFSN